VRTDQANKARDRATGKTVCATRASTVTSRISVDDRSPDRRDRLTTNDLSEENPDTHHRASTDRRIPRDRDGRDSHGRPRLSRKGDRNSVTKSSNRVSNPNRRPRSVSGQLPVNLVLNHDTVRNSSHRDNRRDNRRTCRLGNNSGAMDNRVNKVNDTSAASRNCLAARKILLRDRGGGRRAREKNRVLGSSSTYHRIERAHPTSHRTPRRTKRARLTDRKKQISRHRLEIRKQGSSFLGMRADTAGDTDVKVFDPTEGRNHSRAYSR
jgi:hypothetical protein